MHRAHQRCSKQLSKHERRTRVAELMRLDHTQREIANILGCARSTVANDWQAIREEWAERRSKSIDQLKDQMLANLNALQRLVWPRVAMGDEDAIEQYLKVLDRICKLLGLNAPTRHQVVTTDVINLHIEELERQLRSLNPTPEELNGLGHTS